MNIYEIKELASLMKETGLTKLKVEEDGITIHLERSNLCMAPTPAAVPQPVQAAPAAESVTGTATHEEPGVRVVTSPMVGVFYSAPSPTSEPFVAVGDTVRAGDVLCIIEAMKMMNDITADTDGVITDICVSNTQVVDYGHPLFRIRTESAN